VIEGTAELESHRLSSLRRHGRVQDSASSDGVQPLLGAKVRKLRRGKFRMTRDNDCESRLHAATQHYKDELAGAVDSCEPSLRMRQLADRLMHGHSG
jgi:hypothetical protein